MKPTILYWPNIRVHAHDPREHTLLRYGIYTMWVYDRVRYLPWLKYVNYVGIYDTYVPVDKDLNAMWNLNAHYSQHGV